MNKLFKFLLLTFAQYSIVTLSAQSLSPRVIATAGGYSTAGNASLSYTIGEANTKTLIAGANMLTQGFQQPLKLRLNLKTFLQGFYQSAGLMANVLYNEGVTPSPGLECDTIQIELREATAPYNLVSSSQQVLPVDGMLTYSGSGSLGQSYYIVVKHRNTIQTWSAAPVLMTENTYYDFSAAITQAYGDNLVEVETGVWALYAGDINQDENIDLLDAGIMEIEINNFSYGYNSSDVNGDGNVDLLDNPLLETNINAFIYSAHP